MCVRFPNERTQHDVLHWQERVLNNWIPSLYCEDVKYLVITTRLTLQGISDDTHAYYWKHGVLGRIKEFPLDRIFQKVKSSMTPMTEDTQRCIVFFSMSDRDVKWSVDTDVVVRIGTRFLNTRSNPLWVRYRSQRDIHIREDCGLMRTMKSTSFPSLISRRREEVSSIVCGRSIRRLLHTNSSQ